MEENIKTLKMILDNRKKRKGTFLNLFINILVCENSVQGGKNLVTLK